MRPRWEKILPLVLFAGAFAALRGSSVYGFIAFGLLGAKLVLSLLSKPAEAGPTATTDQLVTVVIPVYNEDPELFAGCLRSLVGQTRRPDKIHVVDDGSRTTDAIDAAGPVLAEANRLGIRTEVTVFRRNRGKREAQGVVFRSSPEATIFLTVDSDTVLDPRALEEGLKPFDDPRVMCATGLVMAVNSERNLLTRLLHLRYVNAFLWERAAYSVLGSVLCACGALALYRAEVIREHLDDFLGQTFLGKPAVFGDDRRLTNYSLLHGRVVLQPTAIGHTAVPERLTHFIRQQIRWNKSFMRESFWVVQNMPLRSTAFWLTFAELASWLVFTITLTATLILTSFHSGLDALGTYFTLVAVMSYVRSAHFFTAWRQQNTSLASRALTYLIAPLYGALHLLLLLPLRTFAALTLFSASWGTRGRVEVRAEGDGQSRPEAMAPADASMPAGPAGGEAESAARVDAALEVWSGGEFEAAARLLEAEVDGPCGAMAREHLDRLVAVVGRLSKACAREYERRLVPPSDDWAEVRDGFLEWASDNVLGHPLPPDTPRSTAPALAGGVVSSVRGVRDLRVVTADAINKDWTRLTLAIEATVTGTCTVPRDALAGGVGAGDIVRVVAMPDADTVSVEWEGSAVLRVTLEARITAETRSRRREAPAAPPAVPEPVAG